MSLGFFFLVHCELNWTERVSWLKMSRTKKRYRANGYKKRQRRRRRFCLIIFRLETKRQVAFFLLMTDIVVVVVLVVWLLQRAGGKKSSKTSENKDQEKNRLSFPRNRARDPERSLLLLLLLCESTTPSTQLFYSLRDCPKGKEGRIEPPPPIKAARRRRRKLN